MIPAIAVRRYTTRLLSAAVLAFLVPNHRPAGDVEVVFDMKSLGEENYCRKYSTDCLAGLTVSPDGKSVWVGTSQVFLRFSGGKRDDFGKDQLGTYCSGFTPLTFDAKGKLCARRPLDDNVLTL